MAAEVIDADVAAQLDVREEAQARVLRGAFVQARHRLDLRMVRRDAGPHEPPRGRQALVDVDMQLGLRVPQQVPRRVRPGRAGTDDRDTERSQPRRSGSATHRSGGDA